MTKRNLLPWDVLTKTVRKTPEEVYESLHDRCLLSPAGQAERNAALRHIENLFAAMDAPCLNDGASPYSLAEKRFAESGYLSLPPLRTGKPVSPSCWPNGNLSALELPDGYEIVKYFSPHVARVRINRSGDEDGTIVETLLKKMPEDGEHEISLLQHLQRLWTREHGENSRPPFPTDARILGDQLLEEEFIYSRPLVPTPDEQAEPVFRRVEPLLNAVDWLHQQEVIHGDLNIHNILVTSSTIRLIDFGNARCPGINEKFFRSGSPGYRAPEAFEEAPATRMDIFSLGATLHLLFFGSLPYDAQYQPIACRHMLGSRLKAVLDRATHLHPDKRHPSVSDLHLDLLNALGLD